MPNKLATNEQMDGVFLQEGDHDLVRVFTILLANKGEPTIINDVNIEYIWQKSLPNYIEHEILILFDQIEN